MAVALNNFTNQKSLRVNILFNRTFGPKIKLNNVFARKQIKSAMP
jgi:hypothetical protein